MKYTGVTGMSSLPIDDGLTLDQLRGICMVIICLFLHKKK